jgi:glycosyltransferase involved in cell wall biosynthesis
MSEGLTERPNAAAPTIAPVDDPTGRPLWSVMVPTHDSGEYLRRTLASILDQAPGPDTMQIEVVDDCSTRVDVEGIVRDVGTGRIAFQRQTCNVGAIANFNTCLAQARGHLVHVLHDDDLVAPGFYQALGAAFDRHPEVGAAFCRCRMIDEHDREVHLFDLERPDAGVVDDFITRLAVSSRIQTPCIAVRRSVYERLGGFDPRLVHAADWEMWQRIVARYPVWYEPRVLASYRSHPASDTTRLKRTAMNVADTRRAIEIANAYLPSDLAAGLRRQALGFYGNRAVEAAWRLRAAGDPDGAQAQLRAAIGCLLAAGLRRRALRVWAAAMKLRVRQLLHFAPAQRGARRED